MSNRIRMWGKRGSSCCQAVFWAADELDIAIDLIPTGGGHGGLSTPEYVAMNPNKVVPTIDDNGLVLWESAAILMYLASTYGKGSLYPADDRARGDAYRWVVWQQTTLRNRLMPLHLEWNVLTDPMSRHLDELEEKRVGLKRLWDYVERHLQGRKHLVGEDFSMADIPIGIMAHWWYRMPIDHFDLPNTRAWYERVTVRPSFKRLVAA